MGLYVLWDVATNLDTITNTNLDTTPNTNLDLGWMELYVLRIER